MKKSQFNFVVREGLLTRRNYIAVKIETEGNPGPEIIVNRVENFDAKIAYYTNAYNDDMELISAKNAGKLIRISDVLMTNSLNDLSWFFN